MKISAKLLDSEHKTPVAFASIQLKGTTSGTTSNEEGEWVFFIRKDLLDKFVVISSIGYKPIEKRADQFIEQEILYLEEKVLELEEVIITTEIPLTAKEIVRKAYKSLADNMPDQPYILEAFVRDLQKEENSYVEFLECAIKIRYLGFQAKSSLRVELQEVRRSYLAKKHPWNEQWERKNAIIDILEDDFLRYDYGPIKYKKGWKYELEKVLPFGEKTVYKIKAQKAPFQRGILYIDTDSYAFVRIELQRFMDEGKYYKERLSNGQQEAAYQAIFEYQEYKGKMYLKYQREEDTWKIFDESDTRKLLFTKHPKKELFIHKIIAEDIQAYPFSANLQISKSIEAQAKPYNPTFWQYYNAPAVTNKLSTIEEELKNQAIDKKK